ncbi:zona pellucida sperm-binding protein 3-like isoform X2 [Rhinatrema bivittatum]|uniref:zona pellucida sperm-binding protein 3-like isoform X2 n=1 Tax=Rhinatrema bivittatum TaxID=194408 RepID=UPI00112C9B5F|nr:zona pellucida sperm-binding protein 3-like isoform X2 [Rhinatrema bivittatum]
MGQRVRLVFGLLLGLLGATAWGSLSDRRPPGVLVPWLRSGPPEAGGPPPVAVRCKEARMVVTVQRDLFGTGRPIKAADLRLGPASCQPQPGAGDAATATFDVGLHECGSSLQMTPDTLIYSTNLFYNPTSSGSRVIVRSNPAVIPIQCTYPRTGNVSSKAIKPTWAPFSSTVSAEERLAFSLRLMNGDWSAERTSTVFHLGDEIHIEASVEPGDHAPLTVFIDSCVATVSPDRDSSPTYSIVDSYGCLVDGKQEDSFSAFRSPRIQPEKLQFTVDAFRFAGNTKSLIYITCNLRAAAVRQAPGPLNKACSFSKTSNMWSAVEGPRNICSCCEGPSCGEAGGLSRGLTDHLGRPSRLVKRGAPASGEKALPDGGTDLENPALNVEASLQLYPILILEEVSMDLGYSASEEKAASHGAVRKPLVLTLVLVSSTLLLALIALAVVLCKKVKNPSL